MNRANLRTLSVVVPAYNEADRVETSIALLLAIAEPLRKRHALDLEVIVVDDGSTDGTATCLQRISGITLVRHQRNLGKGRALRTGFAHASGQIIAIQDADDEYKAATLLDLVEPILNGEADVVYGSRYLEGRRLLTLDRWIHSCLNALVFICLWKWISDMETCQKVFRRSLVEKLTLYSNSFTIEVELTMKLIRAGARYREQAIPYTRRRMDEGKKIRSKDLIKAILAIALYGSRCGYLYPRLRPHRCN